MTKKVRVYDSWGAQLDDEISEGLFNFAVNHGLRCLAAFVVVSAPVFLIGAAAAPSGVNRVDHGVAMVGKQHEFLWGHLGGGIKNTTHAIGSVLGPIIDNGASDDGN